MKGLEEIQMNDNSDLIQKLIDGFSLYTYMVPDDSIPTNRPLHSEGFYLPHIVITGNVFWAMSRTVHFISDQDSYGIAHFGYSNHPDGLFFSYHPSGSITFMSLKRYKSHTFIAKNNWNLIWDSKWNVKPNDHKIDQMLCRGSRFKIAMLDDENIWNIHPVDLPMYHINEGTFNIKTEYYDYPFIIRSTRDIDELVDANRTFFSTKPESNKDGLLRGNSPPFKAFYNLFDNGEYYNFYDIPRDSKQKYKILKVFCEKE